jgi:hypothetical protein
LRRARSLERQRHVELVRTHEDASCTAQQNRLELASPRDAAGHFQQLAQGRPEGDLIGSGPAHIAGEAEEPWASRTFGTDPGISGSADAQDLEHVDQRFDVVDDRGFAEHTGLHRERRLVSRLAAESFDRVEDRGLFPADVRAPAFTDLDVEVEPVTQDVFSEEPASACRVDSVHQALVGQRIFTAQVNEAFLATGGIGRDGHGLDQPEGISFHQGPVLEGAGLRFIRVADQVMRPHRLARHRVPLPPRGKRRASPPHQLRVVDFADHTFRAQIDRPPKGLVAAGRAILIQTRGIDGVDPPEQPQIRVTCLRDSGMGSGGRLEITRQNLTHRCSGHSPEQPVHRVLSGDLQQRSRRLIAEAEARAPKPYGAVVGNHVVITLRPMVVCGPYRPLQLRAQFRRTLAAAPDVITDVQHSAGARHGGEQSVEGHNAVGVGRRNGQPLADVVERALADPAHAGLNRLERW